MACSFSLLSNGYFLWQSELRFFYLEMSEMSPRDAMIKWKGVLTIDYRRFVYLEMSGMSPIDAMNKWKSINYRGSVVFFIKISVKANVLKTR